MTLPGFASIGSLFIGYLLLTGAMTYAAEVPLTVEEPSGVKREAWPVTSGIPFARGVLRDSQNVVLTDASGETMPLQTDVLTRWPDGSVRWLLIDFQTTLSPLEKKRFSLRTEGGDVRAQRSASPESGNRALQSTETNASSTSPKHRIHIGTEDGKTMLDTGPLRIAWDPRSFEPFGAVWLDLNGDGAFGPDERVTRGAGDGLHMVDGAARRFTGGLAPTKIDVEEAGPLRACVRITGHHANANDTSFGFVLRIHAYAGHSFVRCSHTFVVDGKESTMASIEELGMTTRLAKEAGGAIRAFLGDALANSGTSGNKDGGTPGLKRDSSEGGRLFQKDESQYEIDGRRSGKRAQGWATVSGTKAGFAVGLREFWQQWPKSIEAREDGSLTLGLCPDFQAGVYDGKPLKEESRLYYALRNGVYTFKTGVAKTHDVHAYFFPGKGNPERLSSIFAASEEPLLATCDPVYACATAAFGAMPAADPGRYLGFDAWMERAIQQHLARREKEREYGLLNWGDWHGEREVNWGNLEYDLQHGLFLHYLRSGDRRFFTRAEQASRHHIDVDVIHATNAQLKNPFGAPPVVGEIWLHSVGHTGGYYENAALPVEKAYQMGHSSNYGHVWISGDLDTYHLTGDRRAREVALRTADMMSARMTSKVGTHIRTLGWPMILVLAAYEATGEPRYLQAAQRNWLALRESLDPQKGWVVRLASDHCLHPAGSTRQQRDTIYKDQRCQGNVPFMEGLTLCALARYHQVSGDAEVLRAITVGIDQMIRECWQEDVKTFRYTACPLSSKTPYGLLLLSAEALAYEARLTGNAEHARILREGMRSALDRGGTASFGKTLGQMIFFAPHALSGLDQR